MGEDNNSCLAVVRIRGNVDIEREEVLHQIHLNRKNHTTLLNASPSNKGTLQKVKDYVTWGEANSETIELLLKKRGMLKGNKKLTEEYVTSSLNFASTSDLAQKISEGQINF